MWNFYILKYMFYLTYYWGGLYRYKIRGLEHLKCKYTVS